MHYPSCHGKVNNILVLGSSFYNYTSSTSTYTSLFMVKTCFVKDSTAIHFTGTTPCRVAKMYVRSCDNFVVSFLIILLRPVVGLG